MRSVPPMVIWLAMSLYLAAGQAQEKPPDGANSNKLSEAQKQALETAAQTVESEGQSQTAPLALKIGTIAKDFDRNILSEKPDPALDGKLTGELVAAVSEAVTAAVHSKLKAVREMVKVLTPEQKKLLLLELAKPDTNPDLIELVGNVLGDKKK